MKKITAVLMAAALVAFLFSACSLELGGGNPAIGTAIKLGGIGPLTGSASAYGIAVKNGAQIAIEEINAMGGLQFEMQFEDDEHDAEKSVNAYNKLKDWGMQILIGSVTTQPCIAVARESCADRIFEVTPSASSTDVLADNDNVFQICFTDPNQGTASAQYIAENELAAKIAVIYKSDDAYSTGICNTFKAEAAAQKLNIVCTAAFTTETENDFHAQLSEAKRAGADLIFLPIYFTPASLILQQAHQMGFAPKFFGVDGMDGILGIKDFDTSLAEGVYLLTPFSADSNDKATKSFVSKYQAAYHETPNQFAADAYDAVYTICQAAGRADITADMSAADICEAMIPAMVQIEVAGLTGVMTWNASGEVLKTPMAVIIKNGTYVSVQNA